jgi:hypothetical protein
MGLHAVGVSLKDLPAGCNPLEGNRRAFGVVGREFPAIERCLGEFPSGNVIGGLRFVSLLRCTKDFLRVTEQLIPGDGVSVSIGYDSAEHSSQGDKRED